MDINDIKVGGFYKNGNHLYNVIDDETLLHVTTRAINQVPISIVKALLKKDIDLELSDKETFEDAIRHAVFELDIYKFIK